MINKFIGRNVSVINNFSTNHIDERLSPHQLNKTEATALIFIQNHEGYNQSYINNYFLLNKSSITKVINSLERKEYVQRISGEKDKRENLIHLTNKGKALIPTIKTELDEWDEYMTSILSEEEIKQLMSMLYRVAKHISNKEDY